MPDSLRLEACFLSAQLFVLLRYNQAIWASMDPVELSMHLASYSYNGAPLFGQIEPEPVAVTGNLLGFVMRGDEDMSFGGADLPNLWETVAQDLWMVRAYPCCFLSFTSTDDSLTAHASLSCCKSPVK